ncbi:MAG: urease accessory UreF family protein [Candidatus Nanopelagicales bacterium]
MTPANATMPVLMALVDQRLPSGGHVHSGGIEEAVTDGSVFDVRSLSDFLLLRLQSAGLVGAAIAAAAAGPDGSGLDCLGLESLEAETDARLASPIARSLSRAQGRGLLRVARAAWAAPSASLTWRDVGERPHLPILMGCIATAAGLMPLDAALAVAYQTVTGPATAAQRLLSLDPIAVAVMTITLSDAIAQVAHDAALAAQGSHRDLPDLACARLDLVIERHALRPNRLFAS